MFAPESLALGRTFGASQHRHSFGGESLGGEGGLKLPADAKRVKAAGGVSAVTPVLKTQPMGAARANANLPLLPGLATASELMLASADCFRFLKFFPAGAAGGIATRQALGGPFPEVWFRPTGGIRPAAAPEFLALPNVPSCSGTRLTPKTLIDASAVVSPQRESLGSRAARRTLPDPHLIGFWQND